MTAAVAPVGTGPITLGAFAITVVILASRDSMCDAGCSVGRRNREGRVRWV